MHRTTFCSTPNYQAIHESTSPTLRCLACPTKTYRYPPRTRPVCTCISFISPKRGRGSHLQLSSFTEMLVTWVTAFRTVLDCTITFIVIFCWSSTEDMGFLKEVLMRKGCIWMQEQVWTICFHGPI